MLLRIPTSGRIEMMTNPKEQLLYEHIGENALAYLLATDVHTLLQRLDDAAKHPLSAIQEEVLRQLVELDGQLGGWRSEENNTGEWLARLATRPDNGAELSLGNLAHQLAGGQHPEVPVGIGELERTLIGIATENYPGLLVKETDDPFDRRMSLPAMRYRNILVEKFQALCLEDSELSRMFPDNSETSGPSGYTSRSTGQGGSHQLWLFADTVVRAGWTLAQLSSPTPSLQEFIDAILQTLGTIRATIRGEETLIPARVGLTGVTLPEAIDQIDLGWARVRRVDDRDEKFIKGTTLTGQLTGTNRTGKTTVINYSGDLVMEIEVPFIVMLESAPYPWPESLQISYRAIETAVENLRLGLLLAFPDERIVLHTSWQVMLDPYSQYHSASWWDVTRAVNLVPTALNKTRTKEWAKWARRIGKHRIPTVGVAIRRMLASVAERRTLEDILVDAVIVWENLFGARTETTLRVTSSLAWLLGEDGGDRLARQNDYKKIYEFRSRVVHGSSDVSEKNLQDFAPQAVQISVDALRKIFSSRIDLLEEPKSEKRSIKLMHEGNGSRPGTKPD